MLISLIRITPTQSQRRRSISVCKIATELPSSSGGLCQLLISNAQSLVCSTHHMRSAPVMYSTIAMSTRFVHANAAIPPYPRFGPRTQSKRHTRLYPDIVMNSISSESHVSCKHRMSTWQLRSRASSSAFRLKSLQQFTFQTRILCQKSLSYTQGDATAWCAALRCLRSSQS